LRSAIALALIGVAGLAILAQSALATDSTGSGNVGAEEGSFPIDPSFANDVQSIPPDMPTATRSSPAVPVRLKALEGFSSRPYADPAGQTKTYSIGYGYQIRPGETFTTIDTATANVLLDKVIAEIDAYLPGMLAVPVTQNQYDALVLFAYNVGRGAFASSTMLRRLNSGDYAAAAAEFPRWVKAGNITLPALVARRADEQQLFMTV